jgi:hypothetical protein
MQHGPPGNHVRPVQPRTQLRDVGLHRLKPGRPHSRQQRSRLGQKRFTPVHPNEHAARTQPTQDAPAEVPRPAAELDHAIVRPQRQIIQQPLGSLAKVSVLDLQPAGGMGRLAEDVLMGWIHGVVSVALNAAARSHVGRAATCPRGVGPGCLPAIYKVTRAYR